MQKLPHTRSPASPGVQEAGLTHVPPPDPPVPPPPPVPPVDPSHAQGDASNSLLQLLELQSASTWHDAPSLPSPGVLSVHALLQFVTRPSVSAGQYMPSGQSPGPRHVMVGQSLPPPVRQTLIVLAVSSRTQLHPMGQSSSTEHGAGSSFVEHAAAKSTTIEATVRILMGSSAFKPNTGAGVWS